MTSGTMIERVRQAARQRVLFLPHAVRQMARPDRMIQPREVLAVITAYLPSEAQWGDDGRTRRFQ